MAREARRRRQVGFADGVGAGELRRLAWASTRLLRMRLLAARSRLDAHGETHTVSTMEEIRVERWRLKVLLDAGYPLPLAERLAASEADLHEAVQLLERGCPPATAADILL